jgi:hypothetical protein
LPPRRFCGVLSTVFIGLSRRFCISSKNWAKYRIVISYDI